MKGESDKTGQSSQKEGEGWRTLTSKAAPYLQRGIRSALSFGRREGTKGSARNADDGRVVDVDKFFGCPCGGKLYNLPGGGLALLQDGLRRTLKPQGQSEEKNLDVEVGDEGRGVYLAEHSLSPRF